MNSKDVKYLADELAKYKQKSGQFNNALIDARKCLNKRGRYIKIAEVRLTDAVLENIQIANFAVQRIIYTEDGSELKAFSCQHIMTKVAFDGAHFVGCTFSNIKMSKVSFNNCTFERCEFRANEMKSVDFQNAQFIESSFCDNVMHDISFREAKEVKDLNFQRNVIKGVDLSGAYLGLKFKTEFLNEKPSALKSQRPQVIGFQYPLAAINNLQANAKSMVDQWQVITGGDNNDMDYMRILVCCNKISNNVNALLPEDLNALFKKKWLKKELREFRDNHQLLLKTLHRESVYKLYLQKILATASGFNFDMGIIATIFSHTGRVLPSQPFLHRKALKKNQKSNAQQKRIID